MSQTEDLATIHNETKEEESCCGKTNCCTAEEKVVENNAQDLKKIVRDKYGEIARENSSCCGGSGSKNSCCSPETEFSAFGLDYSQTEGYVPEADLNLGCGIPTEFAKIKQGDTVIDLGSGAGNDVFVVRRLVGETGRVIGVDMTSEMIDRANKNNAKMGYTNVEFMLGDIEKMPLENDLADVIVSNCVLNLVPDKEAAFKEIYRVLKPGAHFCVSDIVLEGSIPPGLKKSAEFYAGCVSGAVQKDEYLDIINKTGFKNIEVKKSREIVLPEEVLDQYLDEVKKNEYKSSNLGIYSITVFAEKA